MADNPNQVGGYELKNCIASGNTTQVWEVTEQGGTVPMAMKLLLPDSLKDADAKASLKHEYKVGSALEHPNFVRFHKIEMTRDHGFFIMDYFRAPSLKAQVSANLPEAQSRLKKMVEAVCQAYVHMHEKGWLHRDIKPDNILMNKTGEVRVIDFSLAVRNATGVMKLLAGKQKNIMGTRTYIAPEIILRRPPTPQSDIYSLGVTIYEVATGAPPFAGLSPNDLLKKHLSEDPAPPSIVNKNVSPDLDALVLKLLSKKPKDRPQEMREVMSMFRNCKFFLEDPVEIHEKKVRLAKENESLSVDKRLDSRADADRVSRGLSAPEKPKKGKRTTAPIGELAPVKKSGTAPAQAAPQQPMAGMMPQMPFGMPGAMMPGMMYPGMMPQPMMPQPMMPMGGPMMPGQPMPGMMPPGMMPGQPMPGMMQPGMMQPGMMQPGMMPPGIMPGQPMPGVPQQPQMAPGMSPAAVPPQMAPAAPPVAQPVQPAPVQQSPVQQSPVQQQAPAPKSVLLPLERRLPSQHIQNKTPDDENLEFMTELPDID